MAGEGEFDKIDGDIFYASEANQFHNQVKEIYVGTGFDSTQSGSGTNTDDHELTAVASTQSDFIRVTIIGTSTVDISNSVGTTDYGTIQLKAQIKETGESYADIVAFKDAYKLGGGTAQEGSSGAAYLIYHELTNGQKTNGYQIKVFSSSDSDNALIDSSFTNVQTVVEEI